MIRLAHVIETFEAEFLAQYRDRLTPEHARALTAIKQCRTLSGAHFLWLVLQHVLPKGFRRARNFGFLHPNSKRLIALRHVLLKFAPPSAPATIRQRPPVLCACCGAVMRILKPGYRRSFAPARRFRSAPRGVLRPCEHRLPRLSTGLRHPQAAVLTCQKSAHS